MQPWITIQFVMKLLCTHTPLSILSICCQGKYWLLATPCNTSPDKSIIVFQKEVPTQFFSDCFRCIFIHHSWYVHATTQIYHLAGSSSSPSIPFLLPFPPLPPCPSSLPKLRPPPSSSFPSPSPCPFLPPTFMLIPYSSSCTLGTLLLLLAGCTLHPGIWKVWSDDYIRADGPHLHYKTIQTQKQHGGYLESLPKTFTKNWSCIWADERHTCAPRTARSTSRHPEV